MDDKSEIKETGKCSDRCGKLEVPSNDEVIALNEMRTIKNRVRDLKKRLSDISSAEKNGDPGEIADLERELAGLKVKWMEWEKKREDAARKRMILLGHEEP